MGILITEGTESFQARSDVVLTNRKPNLIHYRDAMPVCSLEPRERIWKET